jgi:NAD-dependent dihydropyrimidine dehydrogenase PreA subunit
MCVESDQSPLVLDVQIAGVCRSGEALAAGGKERHDACAHRWCHVCSLCFGVCPAASLARKIYVKQGLGVGALRRQYGGRNKRKVCERSSKVAQMATQ